LPIDQPFIQQAGLCQGDFKPVKRRRTPYSYRQIKQDDAAEAERKRFKAFHFKKHEKFNGCFVEGRIAETWAIRP